MSSRTSLMPADLGAHLAALRTALRPRSERLPTPRSQKHRHGAGVVTAMLGAVLVLLSAGCRLGGNSTLTIDADLFSGLLGWDLSACGGGFRTCAQLLADNQQQLLGGSFADVVGGALLDFAKR